MSNPDFQPLRDQWALKFPYPATYNIESQLRLDKAANPHNDSYKPPFRSEAEIVSDLAYHFADCVLKQQYGLLYRDWIKTNCVEGRNGYKTRAGY